VDAQKLVKDEGKSRKECPQNEWELFLSQLGPKASKRIAPLLEKERLDLDVLRLCTEEDLKGIGIFLGDRKRILHAIECLSKFCQ